MSNYRVQADDVAWRCHPHQGVSYKSLRYDRDTKSGAVMIHMCPNTTYPEYRSLAGQDIYVVDGELLVDGESVKRGAYAFVAPGTQHTPRTEHGCVLFVSFPGAIEHIHADG